MTRTPGETILLQNEITCRLCRGTGLAMVWNPWFVMDCRHQIPTFTDYTQIEQCHRSWAQQVLGKIPTELQVATICRCEAGTGGLTNRKGHYYKKNTNYQIPADDLEFVDGIRDLSDGATPVLNLATQCLFDDKDDDDPLRTLIAWLRVRMEIA